MLKIDGYHIHDNSTPMYYVNNLCSLLWSIKWQAFAVWRTMFEFDIKYLNKTRYYIPMLLFALIT